MQVIDSYPPNIDQIRYFLDPPDWAVYAYGDNIHAPGQKELYPDIVIHEKVHFKQQKKFRSPGEWWDMYLTNTDFRLEQEREAYGTQYLWLKKRLTAKDLKLALQEMALAYSLWYNLPLSLSECETLIRKYNAKSSR